MSYSNFYYYSRNDKSIKIEHVKNVYSITENGNFKRKPDTVERETVTGEFYENFIRSVSFFNGFCGGSCRAYKGHTVAGYIPVKVVTVNPSRTEKHIDIFNFIF